jgi:hypothetical protein
MNDITYAVSVDVNNPIIPYNVYVASVLDSNVRYLEITLYQNGDVIALSNTATATASLVTDDVLIDDSVECTISNNIITVPLEDLQRHGNLDVQVTVTEDTKVLAIPFPIQVRVTPNIAENAQINENSMGSYAEVVQEIAEARGSYDKLKDRLDHTAAVLNTKADAEEVYKKSEVYSKSEVDEAVNNKTIDNTHIQNGAVTEDKLSADVQNKLNGITPGGDIDPSDYYTKDEVDSALLDKADTSAVPGIVDGMFSDPDEEFTGITVELIQESMGGPSHYWLVYYDSQGDRHKLYDLSAIMPDISGKADKADTYTKSEVDAATEAISTKQDKLTAGENITISDNNVISAEGGGVTDYDELTSRPQINGVTLTGDKTSSDLKIQPKLYTQPDGLLKLGNYSTDGYQYIYIDEENVFKKINLQNTTSLEQGYDIVWYKNDAQIFFERNEIPVPELGAYIKYKGGYNDGSYYAIYLSFETGKYYYRDYVDGILSNWQEIGSGSQIVSGVVNQNGTITSYDKDGNPLFTTTGDKLMTSGNQQISMGYDSGGFYFLFDDGQEVINNGTN